MIPPDVGRRWRYFSDAPRGGWSATSGPGALLGFGLALIVAGLISLLTISARGDDHTWLVPEGSHGVKLGLSALIVVAGPCRVSSIAGGGSQSSFHLGPLQDVERDAICLGGRPKVRSDIVV